MWTIEYLMSQISVIVAVIFFSATYLTKKHKLILIFSSVAALFYGISYLLLGSLTGFVVNLIAILRGIWIFFEEKTNSKIRWVSLLVIEISIIIVGVKTWNTLTTSLLPVLANLLFTFALWQNKNIVYRILSLLNSLIWILFNSLLLSILGIISESIILIVEIVGLILYFKKRKENEIH